ncbi:MULTISPECIES: MaoC family dehydratase [Pseudoalteromonas]|uniref:Acyl dehydratase n=1 Tax=Pseudoalteromonas luteoviolacea (strain 2ta16) TaxID=1353533 RepID=V4H3X0_PSEL2|nr:MULTISPECIES: MaoC family dehydratase [Pseudoalteromonas]ESP92176.1 acyl dehydratase [Pseudoalteromonas luteoviolacea 2ta16]KZN29282.1 hypothetical protein N483_07560 [Pseudoalteromonas luteoviolacea NCIMB 1944]MCG7546739.1 MaoC family dehydratase [Pseudoalteromonas sp. Of7M-16]
MTLYTAGKTYRELNEGDSAVHSKTISESDVYSFAGITGDFNPLHVDSVFAQKMGLAGRIAHAGIAPAMVAQVIGMKLPGVGSMVTNMTVSHHAPLYIGDTIYAHVQVTQKLPNRHVRLTITILNQDNELICSGEVEVVPPKASFKKRVAAIDLQEIVTE